MTTKEANQKHLSYRSLFKVPQPGYVIAFVHSGTDLAVIDATVDDHDDCIFDDHKEALETAKRLAAEMKVHLYDFTWDGISRVQIAKEPTTQGDNQ
tara:strand:- start:1867 stop:2154 length:288 start_codon:yes stop_codon:yes gene_type:complete